MTASLLAIAAALVVSSGGAASHVGSRLPARRLPWRQLSVWVALPLGLICGGAAVALTVAVVAATVAVRGRRGRAAATERAALAALRAALEVVIAELRVGSHPAAACARAAADTADVAWEAIAGRAVLGGDPMAFVDEPSFASHPARVGWLRVAIAWRLAERHGLALGELLHAASDDLRSRRAFDERAVAALAGPRMTAVVLAGLPLLGIALGEGIGAHPVALLTGGGFGGVVLVSGVVLACGGVLWVDAITAKAGRPC